MDDHFMTVLRTEKTFSEKFAELELSRIERIRISQESAHDESLSLFKEAQKKMDGRAEEVRTQIESELKQIDSKLQNNIETLDALDVSKVALKIMKKVMK